MRPFLPAGNWVGIEWIPSGSRLMPVLGELVLCRSTEGTWVVHRVVGEKDDGTAKFVIKGDASFSCEEFAGKQIWGKVKAIRTQPSKKELVFHLNRLDRWIARSSYWSAHYEGIRSI